MSHGILDTYVFIYIIIYNICICIYIYTCIWEGNENKSLKQLNPNLIVRQGQGPNPGTLNKLNPESILAGIFLVCEAIISGFNCLSTSGLRKQLTPDVIVFRCRFAVFVSVPHLGSSRTTITPDLIFPCSGKE